MTKKSLLVFGTLPPASCPSARLTVHTAQCAASTGHVKVTVVISDHAFPPSPLGGGIDIMRERDILANRERYATAARHYILGDTYESLFALRLLKQAPGTLMVTNMSMHTLLRLAMETDKSWPISYETWLKNSLPSPLKSAAELIVKTITSKQRESFALHREIPALPYIETLATHLVTPPLAPAAIAQKKTDIAPYTADEESSFHLLATGGGRVAEAIAELKKLNKRIELQKVTGSEPDLEEHVVHADAVLISGQEDIAPALFTLALAHSKPLIGCGKWAKAHRAALSTYLVHEKSLHQMVAAIGYLLAPEVHAFERHKAATYWSTLGGEALLATVLEKILLEPTSPLPERSIEAPLSDTEAPETIDLTETLKEQVALIGVVPPKSFFTEQCPNLPYAICPRFATPALARRIEAHTSEPAEVVLAAIGYETPLIAAENDLKAPTRARSWKDVQKNLLFPFKAVSFGCHIDTIPLINTQSPATLWLHFPKVDTKRKQVQKSGFIESSNCFWQLNAVENHIDFLVLIGVPGSYELSIAPDSSEQFLAVSSLETTHVTAGKPALLQTDNMGLLSFSLSAIRPDDQRLFHYTTLLKTIEGCPLQVKPLHEYA